MRRFWSTRGCCAMGENKEEEDILTSKSHQIDYPVTRRVVPANVPRKMITIHYY
jgi:hypothetical protein